ncbi:hypothetical protein IW140_002740 [Coemansia sp. RSA 1813]|nr:hypothetical protein EV178_003620 [Coemansia sp. RSA 1646]KAJ1769094.1 hypothetical protein LPJ74_004328 [Coemansia sp. RSA 1843]KAJ2088398.1 hypothetical protein IW138_004274 [Coemansia sp. RSA 986]KAJ2213835.1 hypothetical protein EV179_003534 [Coemansia sp. RSA 487]KAJ2569852.1 hypothetical protein IW140_002740 [Coemansia sp. RSA 1813]
MNMQSAFVAANCIDLLSGNKVDTTTTYTLEFTPTGQHPNGTAVDLDPRNITIHPNYDPTTFANNIAIVQFSNATTDSYKAYIGSEKYTGSTQTFVRRAIDPKTGIWGDPLVYNQISDDSSCVDGSPLYAANIPWFACSDRTISSIEDEQCTMPYGITYTENNTDVIVVSNIFSHSVVYGNSLCGTNRFTTLSYYTGLSYYLGFAYSVLKRPINIYVSDSTETWEDSTISSMSVPKNINVSSTMVVGGDLYEVERNMVDSAHASSSEVESATASSDSSPQSTQATSGSDNGISKGAKIAIGVAVPMGVIIIIIGVVILVHIWKVKRQDKEWDPNAQALNLQEVALEMTVNEPYPVPPPYSRDDATGSSAYQQFKDPAMPRKD